MNPKYINKIRNKYLKTIRKFEEKLRDGEIGEENFANYVNQVYFINKQLKELETSMNDFNDCLNTKTKINQEEKLKQDKDEQLQKDIIKKFEPYIGAYYLLSLSRSEM